jgi:hypothetical protein
LEGNLSKADNRAELERLIAGFKGEVKVVPPARPLASKAKIKRPKTPKGALTEIERSISAAEAQMRVDAPPAEEAKSAVEEAKGMSAGPDYDAAVDYEPADGPGDLAHRALRMLKDKRSRGYVEMMSAGSDYDEKIEDYSLPKHLQSSEEREQEARFRAAAKTGKHCGKCGKALEPDEPVWRVRRKYDSDEVVWSDDECPGDTMYGDEEVVAPVHFSCWDQQDRVAKSEQCVGCSRPVHITARALPSWMRHGKRTYCCEDCAKRPAPTGLTRTCGECGKSFLAQRLDARFCSPACRARASRKNKGCHR